jgi:hypothetical protein
LAGEIDTAFAKLVEQSAGDDMRFDEAFDILVEHCARVSPGLAATSTNAATASTARRDTYGNDIWIAAIVRTYWTSRMDPNMLTPQHYLPFYDAAWELCRIGVLRPGPYASMGIAGPAGGGTFSADGFSITEFGCDWLANPARRVVGDPSRISEVFASFDKDTAPASPNAPGKQFAVIVGAGNSDEMSAEIKKRPPSVGYSITSSARATWLRTQHHTPTISN